MLILFFRILFCHHNQITAISSQLPITGQRNASCLISNIYKKKNCGFSMGRNQYWAGRVYNLCVYYLTGTPEGSTESGFMEKPGIEPATPGLQGIAFINYTAGASSNIIGTHWVPSSPAKG